MFHFVRFVQKVLFFLAKNCDMPHFPAGFGLLFPIYMNKGIVDLHYVFQSFISHVTIATLSTDDVDHDRRQNSIRISQRIAKHHPPKHIKLAAIMCLDSVMSTVMNPGRSFIYPNFVVSVNQHFHCKQPRTLKCFYQLYSNCFYFPFYF